MEPPEEPPEKRRRPSLSECCVFCETSLFKTQADNPVVQNPRVERFKAILKAAELRKDGVYDRLLPVKDDILNGSTVIKFHQKYRANYTNKRNIQIAERNTATCVDGVTDDGATDSGPTVRMSCPRPYDTSQLDTRSGCFICGKSPSWKVKVSNLPTGTDTTTRQKVLDAAIQRNDYEIQMRMLSNTDLFAMSAKIIALAIRITSRLTIVKLLVPGQRLINLTKRVSSKVCVRRLKRLSCPKPPLSQPCLS